MPRDNARSLNTYSSMIDLNGPRNHVPIGTWFRGPFKSMIEEYVLSDRALSRGIFAPDFVRQIVSLHQAGEDHAERLWSLLNFEIWQRQFFDGEKSAAPKNMERELALAT